MNRTLISFILVLLILGCTNNSNNNYLQQISKIGIKVPEPSGLSFSNDKNFLVTVSDANATVYWLDFKGNIIKQLTFEGYDYEGITYLDKNSHAVALEGNREIKYVTDSGKQLLSKNFELNGNLNTGFEGIAFNSKNHHTYIANEKSPRMIYELNDSLNIIKQYDINFVSDISGLFYEEKNDILWLVSDESRLVAKCNPRCELMALYKITIDKAEGIAVDPDKKLIYLVSDSEENLYTFKYPDD